MIWIVLALLVGLAGGYYVYAEQQRAAEATRRDELAKAKEELARQQLEQQQKKKNKKRVDITAELKKKNAQAPGAVGDEAHVPAHPLLRHVLGGHKFGITAAAYSPNGRFIATSSLDRTVRVYYRESLGDAKARPQLITLEYDHVSALGFSPDGRTMLVATVNGMVQLYQKLKVKPELIAEFAADHKTDIHSIVMNDIGKWSTIVTCAGGADTDVKFWDSEGKLLQVANTNQVTNYHCVASKDNRYIAVAAYTPEVKIYEITREKNGSFKKANKIMSLQGHRTGIVDLAFNGSETLPVNRIVTTCKDGSIRLWDINVRYALQEDPRVVKTFSTADKKPLLSLDMSPNGKVLVAACDHRLMFLSTEDGREFATIDEAFEDSIKRVCFSPLGDEVLIVGKNAKYVKIFKTPTL